jgi:hypothetical protein
MLLIIATVTIHTCVSVHGFWNENNLHQVGIFTQSSGFGVCNFGNKPVTKMVGSYVSDSIIQLGPRIYLFVEFKVFEVKRKDKELY